MKGVIKNMKEQFLNLSGLTELVTYIKLCIAQHKMIIPRASFSLFPKTGDENNIYIDTSTNSIYRWNDSDKSFVLLAKPPRNISISEGKNNGQITLKVDEIESNATVHGLKSAAFSNASSFATSAQGAKADSAIQSITIAPGTNNGTVKITVNGVTTDNIKVAGLGSAAFSDIAVFAPAKHTHSKSDVGLGNVDNTADIDKSVKYAGSSGSSNTVVYTALTNTDLNTLQTEGKWYYAGGGNTCTNVPVESAAFELYVGRNASGWRYQQFTVTSGEIYIRVFDSSNWGNWRKLAFTSDTVTAASSVPWSGITGKPSTFAPSSHNHTIANITDIGKASVNFANSAGCPQGFALRQATATWGNQTGTVVTDWHTSNGGDIAFRDNKGQLNVVIDGFFYQNEGKNLVLDSGNYSNYAAAKSHTHTISNITNLQTTLDGKSNTNHTHDLNPMINTLTIGTSDPIDADYYIAQYAGGGSTTTTYHRRPHSALWNYIKSKANSVYQPKGSYAASSHTHDDRYYTESEINTKLASKSDTSHTHNYVVGSYTGNGGQQKPNYFGTNKVGFLMMNTTVNGDSNYKDWIIMDCYGGNDVGGSVALGVNRQKLAAYIMRSAAERSSWAESAELLHTLNYTSYTVTKTGSGASGTWGISISGNATTSTKLATARSINGTNFDGSGNITTATWGTARTLTIGNTGKSVNGGGNVSWSLSEIGAAASNHTHSYLPLSGGAMTGNISYRGSKATYKMIEFIDNSSDEYGNGIAIGGGGLTIIGGGESADVVKSTSTRGGDERLILANDGAIDIYTNCQNGIDKATHITIDNTGLYSGTAAKANSVPWPGVTGKPSSYPPSSHTHSSVTDIGSGSTTTFAYSKSGLGYGDFTWLAAWNEYELRAVNKSLFAQASHSHTVSQISGFGTHVYDATISRTANTVLAAPNGKAGSASFRALVAADIPSITKSKITDFPSSLPASDVYAWAKASSKPSYSWSEITGKPSTYTPSSHNHTVIQGTSSTSAVPGKANDGFCEFYYNVNNGLANNMPSSNNANAIISISRHAGDYTSQLGFSSNGNLYYREGVGATAWKTILTSSNYTSYTVTKTGGGASGTWGINITGSSGSCTGNAATASNASKVNGHTVNSDVPSGAKFTDTNTWRPLGTAANTACAGNDSRLSNSRPASDVYSWAKASSKPSYSWSEITSKPSSYTPSSHTHDDRYYTETEINTKLGAKLGAVSANGYYGMARPDGNTSDWIRTTTAGIIPYQSGGAGAGHCGIGTSSWYFSNAYIDTVNCVNASVSGHIDVAGYIQSSNLINTYFEYQSNRGSVDWRFGAATGTGDENFFGFYDAKTGKIPLALDGNFGNIYVGFNVGSYESPTAVGVYLGGQVAGNRAFIYNGDSYQGSIWIQTRLDGSWKWFSLGRACSTALSDIRLKGNIRDTEVEDATKVIESMKIRSFERKDSHKKYKIGFIADELEQLDPNLVDGGGEVDGHPYYKSVNNLQMLAYVVKGMQELNSKVTILEKENKRLKQKLNMCN